MAFHIDTHTLKRIPNYDSAKEVFTKLTPIRGGDQSLRRIGNRNDASKWLKHEIRDGVDVYVAGFHNTDLITYYPTHYKLSMHGWVSISTRLFIQTVKGVGVYNMKSKDFIPRGFDVPFKWDISYNDYPISSIEVYDFTYDDKPITKIEQPVKYGVNRKRMNEVRKEAVPFCKYIDSMDKLLTTHDLSEKSMWASKYRNGENIMANLLNEEEWWEMFEVMSWHTQGRGWDHQTGKSIYWRNVKAMKKMVDDAFKASNPQVLDVVN